MILCGEAPFFGKTDEEIVEKAMQCVYDFSHPQWNHVSERVKHLIEKLLVVESDERLTSREAFEHPWVQKKRVMQASSPSSLKMKDCFVSIEKYATLDPFRKMVFAMIVFYETSQKLDNFRDLFKEVDRDGNGTIDIIEFRNAYLEFFERSGSRGDFLDEESREEHMQRLFRALDVDNSGTISYSDFVVGSLGSVVEIDNVTLRKVFEALDADNAGTVTGEKIKAFITMEKGPYSEKQIEEIVKNAKVLNKTGSMKFKDLRELMRNDGIPMSP
jgi:calcium-dependent protein kinase